MLRELTPTIASRLRRIWQSREFPAPLLLPVAWGYSLLVRCRRLAYQWGALKSQRVGVPVLVVGNAVVGGAGKTPTAIAIIQHLQQQGRRVGVVSRGYGRSSDDVQEVHIDSHPSAVGDEPLLIRRTTGAATMVGRQRATAARALLDSHPDLEILVCDDGLQHYALHRDLEVCVFDARGTGNGWLLPAGPLRELWPAAPIAAVGQSLGNRLILNTGDKNLIPGFAASRRLADYALAQDGTRTALAKLVGPRPLMALAGIAQPERFFEMLKGRPITLAHTLGLPDHCTFDASIRAATDGFQVLCTEKDAVKLWPWVPQALAVPLVQEMEQAFWRTLDAEVTRCMDQRAKAAKL